MEEQRVEQKQSNAGAGPVVPVLSTVFLMGSCLGARCYGTGCKGGPCYVKVERAASPSLVCLQTDGQRALDRVKESAVRTTLT